VRLQVRATRRHLARAPRRASLARSSVNSIDPRRPLARAQAKHGNRWAAVADEFPGRTGQQCAQRWRHKVNPSIRKDKWTEDEDVLVRAAALVARRLRRNTTT
jgi:hypothetical protein